MTASVGQIRILHVDDEPGFRDLACTALERVDDAIEVISAENADAGVSILSDIEVDCVVSDYDMPDANGIEFLQTVRDDHPDLPFILFTGKGSEEVASDAISAGVTDYLQKEGGTDQFDILANRVRNAVSGRLAAANAERRQYRLEQILGTVPSCVVQLNADGEFVYANPRAIEVLGLEESNVVDRTYNDPEWEIRDLNGNPIPDEELPFRQVLDTGQPLHGFRHSIRWPDGSERILQINGAPLLDDTGDVDGVVFSLSDITERLEHDRALQETTGRLEALFEHSPDMINVHDAAGNIIDPNPQLCEETGYNEDELTGMKVWELDQAIDPQRAQSAWTEMGVGDRAEFEAMYRRKDGSTFPVKVHVRRLDIAGSDRFIVTSRGISQRQIREQELETTQRRLDAILENTTTPMFMKDDEGRYIFVNREYSELFGLCDETIVGKTDLELHPEEMAAAVRENDQRVIDEGEPIEAEERITVEGDERVFLTTKVPIYDTGTRKDPTAPVAVFGVAVDITERKLNQQRLKEERQFVQSIFQSLPDPLYALDTEGYPIRWNDRLEAVTGYGGEEISDMHVSTFFPEEEHEELFHNGREILEELHPVTFETEIETASGVRIPFELTGGPLEGADGEIRGLTGIGRDITERKTHERRLEALNRATRRLLTADDREELASMGVELGQEVLGLDANSIHLYDEATDQLVPAAATPALIELVGNPASFDRGEGIAWRVYESGEPTIIDSVADDPDVYNPDTDIESELYLPLGSFGLLIAAARDPGAFDQQDALVGEILAANMVTALEQIERTAELRTRERELSRQNERLERFASIVSHDLRNPLSVASGRLELAQAECDSPHLEDIEQAHERMEMLIEDLLSLARQGDTASDTQPVELAALVDSCWGTVDTKDATIESTLEGTIVADESRVRQLFENLFRNAIDHGGPTVTVQVGALDDGFYVEDDGPGIPEGERTSVFEAGYSTTSDGTGFGLSIVKEIAQAHEWSIELTEGRDGGSRFEITGVDISR